MSKEGADDLIYGRRRRAFHSNMAIRIESLHGMSSFIVFVGEYIPVYVHIHQSQLILMIEFIKFIINENIFLIKENLIRENHSICAFY